MAIIEIKNRFRAAKDPYDPKLMERFIKTMHSVGLHAAVYFADCVNYNTETDCFEMLSRVNPGDKQFSCEIIKAIEENHDYKKQA